MCHSFLTLVKKTAWNRWGLYPDVTNAFLSLTSALKEVTEESIQKLERYVVLLYDRTSNKQSVDKARKDLYTKKLRDIENIPPTRAALIEHIKRSAYIGGFLWGQCMTPRPEMPCPSSWGYKFNEISENWEPFWSSLPDAAQASRELKKCGCKTACQRRCTCKSLRLKCTGLCQCDGENGECL